MMAHSNTLLLNQAQLQTGSPRRGGSSQAIRIALARYREARFRARLGQVWSALSGRSRHLLRLGDVRGTCTIGGSHYAGTQTVSIRQIRGSEGRSEDFDAEFAPLTSHSQWRWLKVASARLQDVPLPPVELIQVGQVYYVRDGHHRISVARAWGQESIEAEVTVWDVVGPLPGEQPAPAGDLSLQPA
jgi:hypothetical protein